MNSTDSTADWSDFDPVDGVPWGFLALASPRKVGSGRVTVSGVEVRYSVWKVFGQNGKEGDTFWFATNMLCPEPVRIVSPDGKPFKELVEIKGL